MRRAYSADAVSSFRFSIRYAKLARFRHLLTAKVPHSSLFPSETGNSKKARRHPNRALRRSPLAWMTAITSPRCNLRREMSVSASVETARQTASLRSRVSV